MRVHIALVGRQTAPIYNCVMHFQPEKVYYIYSSETKRELSYLLSLTSIPHESIEVSASDLQGIRSIAVGLIDRISPEDEVTLNLQGGTKHWSLIFYSVFSKFDNCSHYLLDQNNVLANLNTLEECEIQSRVFTYFQLTGNPPRQYMDFTSYTDDDYEAFKIIERARKSNNPTFNKLTTVLSKEWSAKVREQKRGLFKIDEDTYVSWEKNLPEQRVRLVMKGNVFDIVSPNAVTLVFNSGWFEYKIARMLSHWKEADNVLLNCIFPQRDDITPNGLKYPKNEVDIIVLTKKKAFFVECKTMITSSNDIDKFRTVVRNYGGQSSKAIFVTSTPMLPIQKEKCAESNIITFSLEDAAYGPNKEQELFKLLNAEMSVINK